MRPVAIEFMCSPLKKAWGWKSSTLAKGYLEDSIHNVGNKQESPKKMYAKPILLISQQKVWHLKFANCTFPFKRKIIKNWVWLEITEKQCCGDLSKLEPSWFDQQNITFRSCNINSIKKIELCPTHDYIKTEILNLCYTYQLLSTTFW